jgi:hypothetical protein
MRPTNPSYEEDPVAPSSKPNNPRLRLLLVAALLSLVLILAVVPPLLNVSGLQRRVASNIGASLGRPVHFDRLALLLLPLPGFRLERFVVEEDPAFGSEPILRADQVRATVRLSSLWRHRVEFSKISLTDPSVNLVHTPDGKWNLQSILLQASRIQAAPTDQRYAGATYRFPYIEAAGARINLKLDQEKTPFSLIDADFALWLPEAHEWHFRLAAHPARTDTAPVDTGTLHLEGTLGGATANPDLHNATLAQIPIDLRGNWQNAQLGGLSRLLLGRDVGARGDLTLTFDMLGSIGRAVITTDFSLAHGRRADFVPPHPLALEARCQAVASEAFHAFSEIECHWPPASSSEPSIVVAIGAVPDIGRPQASYAELTLPALPAPTLLEWVRVATPYPPNGLAGTGTLAGVLSWHPDHPPSQPAWSGELEFSGESLQIPALSSDPIPLGEILLRSASPIPSGRQTHSGAPSGRLLSNGGVSPGIQGFELLPISLPLGGRQPATLWGFFDTAGYTLHLDGNADPARLLALGDAIPQLGEGLRPLLGPLANLPAITEGPGPDESDKTRSHSPTKVSLLHQPEAHDEARSATAIGPIRIDLTAVRKWGGPQIWQSAVLPLSHPLPLHQH